MTERDLIDPMPELPDDTPIDCVRFPTRIRNVLAGSGLKTVGEVRETTDETLLTYQDMGPGSIKHLRDSLGLPSIIAVSAATPTKRCR
jgi:DNA-directed RNA polymerase alpha subunit